MSAAIAISEEFDVKAPVYESSRLAPWYQAHADFLLEHLEPIAPGEVVVDVGCATGYLLRRLAERRGDVIGIGLDLSAEMVRLARAKSRAAGLRSLTFLQADWEDPGARAGALGTAPAPSRIVCASTLHYFADPYAALTGMFDALRPGGEVLILERAPEDSRLTRLWDHLHRHLIRDQVRFHDSSALVTMLRAAGFERAGVRSRLRKRFWKGKLHTNMALIGADKSGSADLSGAAPPRSC